MQRLIDAIYKLFVRNDKQTAARVPAPARAVAWIRAHESARGGIVSGSDSGDGGVLATGALLPTIFLYGECDLGIRCLQWLLRKQQSDGSFRDSDARSAVLPSSYVLLGLLATGRFSSDEVVDSARRVSEHLWRELVNPSLPDAIRPVLIWALSTAGKLVDEPKYLESAASFLEARVNSARNGVARHLLGHELTALIELDQVDRARRMLQPLLDRQKASGAMALEGTSCVSSPVLGQLACCCYRLGEWAAGDKALAWLEKHQCPSGGFLGSYGWSASYYPNSEVASAVKWYLDAHRLRVQSAMARCALPSTVALDDGRLHSVLRYINSRDRVVEVGCGKGRFLKAIRELRSEVSCTGVDITPSLLAEIPDEISRREGSLECVPYPDGSFDVTFSIEAIEHSANWEAAIRELSRITRPGGWVLIIDKPHSRWGRLECLSWEAWPDAHYLAQVLERYCDEVAYEPVGYDDTPADGLMVLWKGRRRPLPAARS